MAALTTAGLLAACTTTVDGTASFGGGGTVATGGTDTGTVPTPSDPTISTDPTESSTSEAPTTTDAQTALYNQCLVPYQTAQDFLPTWDSITALPDPTIDDRKTLSAAMNTTVAELQAELPTITDNYLTGLFNLVISEVSGVSGLVTTGQAANLDNYTNFMTQIQVYCNV